MTADSIFLSQGREITRIAPDALAQAVTSTAYRHWLRLRQNRPWPARDEMKLRDFAGLIHHMSLVRVIDHGADFEHRIVGDSIVRSFSVALQNRRFSDIACDAPKLIESSLTLFRAVLTCGAPIAWRQRVVHSDICIVYRESEMVLLPFGPHDGAIDHIAAFGVHSCDTRS